MKDNWAGAHGSGISIHALREEGDLSFQGLSLGQHNFYPRPPRGGRHRKAAFHKVFPVISIHALREEGDEITLLSQERVKYFYPRPPRGGRPGAYSALFRPQNISIHALREEGDSFQVSTVVDGVVFLSTPSARRATCSMSFCHRKRSHFYPRPPRGGRLNISTLLKFITIFLSTPSARRATSSLYRLLAQIRISIHALREEGDG